MFLWSIYACKLRVSPRHWLTLCQRSHEPLGASGTHPRDGSRNHLQAEQIRQEFRKPILGQKVIVEQIDHKGADPRTILSGCCHALGKWRRRDRLAVRQTQLWARCLVTTTFGSGTSKTCR